MTLKECIDRVDAVKPNQYGIEQKVAWLSYLDGIIKNDIIDPHDAFLIEHCSWDVIQLCVDDCLLRFVVICFKCKDSSLASWTHYRVVKGSHVF